MNEKEYGLFLLYRQLANESDRGAVIISAALLDDALLNLLKAKLCPSLERDDELFDGIYAPLGNFAAKIDLSYRIGLISAQYRRILHLMRKLRNDFAHTVHKVDFNDPTVQDRLRELFRLTKHIICAMWQDLSHEEETRLKEKMDNIKTGKPFEDMFTLVGKRKVFDYVFASMGWILSHDYGEIQQMRSIDSK